MTSENKVRNTLISEGQIVPMKRITKQNRDTLQYEPIKPDKDGQVKMVSKGRIKVKEDGLERTSRVMVTVRDEKGGNRREKEDGLESEDHNSEVELDICKDNANGGHDLSEEDDDLGETQEVVIWDENESEDEVHNRETIPGLVPHDPAKEIDKWTQQSPFGKSALENIKEAEPNKIVEPEHFDKTSIITDTDQTLKTEEHKYKIAQNASTKYMETHSTVEKPSEHFAKRTTLLVLACKTNKWDIVEILLKNYKIDVNHKDAGGSNALHLAISAGKADVCKLMIPLIIVDNLKSEVNVENKNALKLVSEFKKKYPNR